MGYIGQNLPTDVFGGYTTDTFAGDGSATTFTLSQEPISEQGLIVVINNVIQQPTTNYTVSGTTLTIVGTAVASGDVIYARHTGVALPIGEANALDLQGQSDKLILDADADTTISADTDDQIDFKAGGTDTLFVTNGKVGITSAPDLGAGLHIKTADSGASVAANYDEIVIENSDHAGMSILTGTDKVGAIRFGDSGDNDIGGLIYNHDGNSLTFKVNASDAMSIASSGATTITVADNSDTLTLKSTDADGSSGPNLKLARDSGSPADGDVIGQIIFTADDDAGNATDFFTMSGNIRDASNGNEEVQMVFYGYRNGAVVNYLEFDDDHVVFNEGSADIDFRVESNGDANCLFVNAGDDKVQIGGDASSDGSDTRIDLFNFGQMNIFRNASSDVFTIIFNNTNSGNISGSIRQNGDATAFNTSSDYRLKENVDYTWDATTKLKQLKPAKFNWISDDTNTLLEGFLAHEVSGIVPQAVSGEKDKVATADDVAAGIANSVGDAIHQGIDQSKLVPLLVKTVQELEARIKTLEDA